MLQNANITKDYSVKDYQKIYEVQSGFNVECNGKRRKNAYINVKELIALKAQNKTSGDLCVASLDVSNLFGDEKDKFFKLSTTEP